MKLIKLFKEAAAATALLMMMAVPLLVPTEAEARRAVAGCGARGCAAVGDRGAVAVRRPPTCAASALSTLAVIGPREAR